MGPRRKGEEARRNIFPANAPSPRFPISFKSRAEKSVGKAEMQMAEKLIESMTTEWTDEYRDVLEKLDRGKD